MKKLLLLNAVCLLFSGFVFGATAPESLTMQGSALNESTNPMQMKLMDNNTYELITSLKTGDYSFSDASATGNSITVEGENVPYFISVNYDGATPAVSVKKIEKVILWAPWNGYTMGELTYNMNSTFKGSKFLGDINAMGDNRYRIRVIFTEDDFRTYGNVHDYVPTDETDQEYYDMHLTENGVWFDPDKKYKLAKKYEDKYYDVEVKMNATENYTHFMTPHQIQSNLPIADQLQINGNALAYGDMSFFLKKDEGVFEYVGALKEGTFKLKGTKDGQDYFYTLSEGKLIEGDTDFPVTGTEATPYYIKVDLTMETFKISAINSCYLNFGSGSEEHRIAFTYSGNNKYAGKGVLTIPMATWGQQDERYKFRMDLADNTMISWGASTEDAQDPSGEMGSEYYRLNPVNNDNWAYSFKIPYSLENKTVEFELIFNGDGVYKHTYKEEGGDGIESIQTTNVAIFPTVVQNEVTISVENPGFEIELISLSGTKALTAATTSSSLTISDVNVPNGIYIIKITQNGKLLKAQRIIKQ